MTLYLSHSPASKSKISNKWFKSIKDTNSVGGNIVMNVFGDTKEEAEYMAEQIIIQIGIKKFIRLKDKLNS